MTDDERMCFYAGSVFSTYTIYIHDVCNLINSRPFLKPFASILFSLARS